MSYNFNDVKFIIQEFESVDILEGCYLAFYLPKERHLEAKQSEEYNKEEIYLVDKVDDNNQHIKKISIDKSKSQKYIEEKNKEKEERISKLGLNAGNIDDKFNALGDEAIPKKKLKRNNYDDYDVFYDVYTNQGMEKCIKKIEVKNGVARVEAEFFQNFFQKSEKGEEDYQWCIIPRLIPEDINKMNEFEFDPVPIKTNCFVITDFHNATQRTLTFQRRRAKVNYHNYFNLQSPKEFRKMLDGEESAQYNKEEQAKKMKESADRILDEIDSYEISEETKKLMKDKWKEKSKECEKVIADSEKRISGKTIGDTGEYVTSRLFANKSTRYLSNQRKIDANFNLDGFNHTIPDFLVEINDYPSLVEVKNVQVQSLTEQISFELKLAREYELDYVFFCNHYSKLLDNLAGKVLSIEEHQKLAEDKEKVENFNAGTKEKMREGKQEILKENEAKRDWSALQNIKTSRLRSFSEVGGDSDARSGFIDHRHLHRSIKTAFKEIYLHHVKGAAPNKIIIKRLNLNDAFADELESILNDRQDLQKCKK